MRLLWPRTPQTRLAFNVIEYCFVGIFTLELTLKHIGLGFLFWLDEWNIADTVIIGISVIEIVMEVIADHESSG